MKNSQAKTWEFALGTFFVAVSLPFLLYYGVVASGIPFFGQSLSRVTIIAFGTGFILSLIGFGLIHDGVIQSEKQAMTQASEGDYRTGVAKSGLLKKARAIDVLTFLAVILISPASVVFSIPLGVAPEVWLEVWTTYVIGFILLAMGLGLFGFGLSTHYKLEADRLERKAV